MVILTKVENQSRSRITMRGLCRSPYIFIPSVFGDFPHLVSREISRCSLVNNEQHKRWKDSAYSACSIPFGLLKKSTVVPVALSGNPVTVCTRYVKIFGPSTTAKHRAKIPRIEIATMNSGMCDSHYSKFNFSVYSNNKHRLTHSHYSSAGTSSNPCDSRP